ncbi:hypothetical protein GQ457_02G004130 [Hibiscus cannabinus]
MYSYTLILQHNPQNKTQIQGKVYIKIQPANTFIHFLSRELPTTSEEVCEASSASSRPNPQQLILSQVRVLSILFCQVQYRLLGVRGRHFTNFFGTSWELEIPSTILYASELMTEV